MQNQEYVVDPRHAAQTVAGFLRAMTPGLSWAEARRHCQARRVLINGVVCLEDARRLKAGDRLLFMADSAKPLPGPGDVELVYEDEQILVIDKPAGMECERRKEQVKWPADKRRRQLTLVESLEQRGFQVRPVHRLDRDTSGLMVYARTPEAQAKLIATFARHEIERRYLAVAIGRVKPATVHGWIVRDRGDGLRGSLARKTEEAEEAITQIEVVEAVASGKYTLLECRLETGKTHQIRIHLAEMGHPLCGEKLYLRPKPDAEPVVDSSKAPRQALHCWVLGFPHPQTGEKMRFESELPGDLERWLRRLRA